MKTCAVVYVATLVAALAAPAGAATVFFNGDLVMVAGPDGRPMFRPVDGVDSWGGKYATQRPRARPCEPLPTCLTLAPADMMALLLGQPETAAALHISAYAPPTSAGFAPRPTPVSFPPVTHTPPHTTPPAPEVPPIPLPATGWLLIAALAALFGGRRLP